jgi:hypothetical protein
MMNPQQVSSRLLAHGKRPATLESLIDLYQRDRELFFALACVGVGPDSDPWAVEVAGLAARLRGMVQRGYEVSTDPLTQEKYVRSRPDQINFQTRNEQEVIRFLRELNGTSANGKPGKDYAGTEVSEAEVLFALGDPATWEADQVRLAQRMRGKPLVLRLDEADRRAVNEGMPAYVVYGLRYSAPKLVQLATVLYRGLRREGKLKEGYAFCGRLRQAYDNQGQTLPAPPGMVYVVYADPEGHVFDWDWVKEDPHHPGHPIDTELRFTGNPEPVVPEAVLVGVEDLAPVSTFDPRKAWFSPKGDCLFCYFSDEFAFADRIDNDLTVFRSVANDDPTGFKIKNVQRMLDEGSVQLAAPDLAVEIQAFLLASLLRNPDTRVDVYSVLIGAWMRRAGHTEPPKITVPSSRQACPTGT